MSRQISPTGSLTDAERNYLLARGRSRQVHQRGSNGATPTTPPPPENEPSGSGSTPVEPEQPTEEERDWVSSLSVEELKSELAKEGESTAGKKVELQARLLSVLAAQG